MQNYTVLTYIIGDYETVHEIEFDPATTPHVEYLLITDNKNLKSNTWKVIYDESLVDDSLESFDRVFSIRYNLFKYASHDICIRIDGSIGIIKPLDEMIQTFINGEYDGCFNIHPGRDNIIEECFAWTMMREFSPYEALYQIKYIKDALNYNFNTKGLIEQNITISRRGVLSDCIDNDMKKMMIDGNLSNFTNNNNIKHYTRLDQTLITALIFTKYSNCKWMFIRDSVFEDGGFFNWYAHGGDKKLSVSSHTFIPPYFNNEKVETLY